MSIYYKHTPLSLEELEKQSTNDLHEGWAAFQIMKVEEGHSKAQNPIVIFTFQAVNEDGKNGRVWDKVPLQENCEWRLGNVYRACGLYELYKKETLCITDLLNAKGAFNLNFREWQDKKYLNIDSYIFPGKQMTKEELSENNSSFNDYLPY